MNETKPKHVRIVDREVLGALRSLGTQQRLLPLRRATGLLPDALTESLERLRARGLVNLHYAELDGGVCLRYIVPVDIVPRKRK